MAKIMHSLFVSSTYEDLREERAKVQEILLMQDCFPVGMELFPSTDEESWEFIKRQIEEADYYLLILAGRYGSVDKDGIGYTEKEYDYAREIKKTTLAFIHQDLNKIEAGKSEKTDEGQKKRDNFIDKVKSSGRLAKFYNSVEDLGGLVAVSIAKIKGSHPQPGFVRANEMADPKKYADLLEENAALKARLANIEHVPTLFRVMENRITITLVFDTGRDSIVFDTSLGVIFFYIADYLIDKHEVYEMAIADSLREYIIKYHYVDTKYSTLYRIDSCSLSSIKKNLCTYNLIYIADRIVYTEDRLGPMSIVWKLTNSGHEQYLLLLKQKPSE